MEADLGTRERARGESAQATSIRYQEDETNGSDFATGYTSLIAALSEYELPAR